MPTRAIMLMFDSLNRHLLPPYGGQRVHAQNFQRLKECGAPREQYQRLCLSE